jgi:hypothetical protein
MVSHTLDTLAPVPVTAPTVAKPTQPVPPRRSVWLRARRLSGLIALVVL